ncbi:MAG: hypothetical protein K6V36_08895 [Anaerolineae bacterium]|nr:hypothetical protein [Anaerolineae bacterium]
MERVNSVRRLLFCVGVAHVLGGSLMAATVLTVGVLLLRAPLGPGATAAALVPVGPFCALLAASRLRLPPQPRMLRELGVAAALGALLAAGVPAVLAALGLLPALAASGPGGLPGAVASLLAAAPAYLLLRGMLVWLVRRLLMEPASRKSS